MTWACFRTAFAQACALGLFLLALDEVMSGHILLALLFLALGIGGVLVANAMHRLDR